MDQEYTVKNMPPSLERVVRLSVMSYENARAQADRAQLSDGQAIAGPYLAIEEIGPISEDPPWKNSKERRRESRANLPGNLARLQQHHAEPPPSAAPANWSWNQAE